MVEGYTDVIALHQAGSRTRSPPAARRWGRGTSGCSAGSPSARSWPSTPTRRAHGPPSGLSRSRRSSLGPGDRDDHPPGPGPGRLRPQPRGRRGERAAKAAGRSRVHAAPHDRPRRSVAVEGQSPAVADVMPILSSSPIPCDGASTPISSPTSRGSPSPPFATMEPRRAGPSAVVAKARSACRLAQAEREMLKLLVRDPEVYDTYEPRLTDEHFRSAARAGRRRAAGCRG